MWTLRILSGPQAGQIFTLQNGPNIIGRAPNCDIKITSPNVSKRHLKIEVINNKIVLTDLGSSNGTFVNGVKLQSQIYRNLDKIVLYDVVLDIVDASQGMPLSSQNASWVEPQQNVVYPQFQNPPNSAGPQPGYDGNLGYQAEPQMQEGAQTIQPTSADPKSLAGIILWIQNYFENVVLPGVYKLPEVMDFKWVLALFVGAFILFVTSLSSIPMMSILKASVEEESQRRALTIARIISDQNRPALSQGLESAVSVEFAQREPGVETALIINALDGSVVAPSTKAGSFPDLPFIHEARKTGKASVKQIDDNTIGALVPIEFYNSKTGSQTVSFYSVIIYNMGTLAVDDERTLSLFIQTFFIALIAGSILFYFMLKLIQRPLVAANEQLDLALKDGSSNLSSAYQYEELQTLISNINTALTRVIPEDQADRGSNIEYDRTSESHHLIELIGFPALSVQARDLTVSAVNYAFEERTGINAQNILHSPVDNISDQALRLSIQDLVERAQLQPDQLASNDLEIGGANYQVSIQAVFGKSEVSYFVLVLLPTEEGEFE